MKTQEYLTKLIFEKIKNFGRKVAKNTILPLTFLTAVLAPSLASSQQSTKSSLADIIETGTLEVFVRDAENNNPLNTVTATLTASYIPGGDSIPPDYQQNGGPLFNFEVLTFADLGIGINEYANEQITAVRPSVGSDFTINYFSQDVPSSLIIRDVQGRTIKEVGMLDMQNSIAEFYVDLSQQADGMYFATTIIDGQQHTEKLMKINAPTKGKLPAQSFNKSSTTTLEDAIYELNLTAPGYQDYQTTLSLATGDNGVELVYLQPNEGLPQNQDLTGRVYLMDDDNNITTATNATVYVRNTGTNQTISTTTNANGDWIINDFPLNPWNDPNLYTAEVSFEYDGNHYAIQDVYYTTPQYDESSWSASDTIHGNLNALLPTKREGTTALHIGQHAGRGSVLDTIKFYLGNSYNETRKQNIRDHIADMNNQVNNLYTFVESTTELGNDGINFEDDGVNTTTSIDGGYETSWNHVLAYTTGANTSLSSTSSFLVTIHELLRGLGHDGVGWYCIMDDFASDYTEEDRIIQNVARPYYNAAYHDQIHAIQITKLVEQLDSKKKESAVPQEIETNNVIYHFTN